MRTPRAAITLALLSSLLFVVAACGSQQSGVKPEVSAAWVRPPMGEGAPAAGYMTITSTSDVADWLVAVTTPAAEDVELHETMAGASGMTAMQPVDRIEVAPGATVKLEPGGYHLMLLGLTEELVVGQMIELTVTFEESGTFVVQAEVKAG